MPRNYVRERLMEDRKRKKDRAARNKARRMMIKAGKAKVGDGRDIDHKRPLRAGGTSTKKNIRVRSAKANRADNGGKGGRPKGGKKKLPTHSSVMRRR